MENAELEELAAQLKALAHPARLAVVMILADSPEMDVANLQHLVEVSWPDLSRHLKVLQAAGLIISRREGTRRLYRLKRDTWPDQLRGLLRPASL